MTSSARQKVIVFVTLSLLVLLIGAGTVLFKSMEGWTWAQSFYFTIVTITTVGYGDLTPSTDASRIVTAIYIILGVAIAAGIISMYGSYLVKNRVNKRLEKKHLEAKK